MLAWPDCQVKNEFLWSCRLFQEKKFVDLCAGFLYSISRILTEKSMSLGDNDLWLVPSASRVSPEVTRDGPVRARGLPMDALWPRVRQLLQETLTADEFLHWIEPLKEKAADSAHLVLRAPTRFHYEWIREHYLGLIRSSCRSLDRGVRIELLELAAERKSGGVGEVSLQNLPLSTHFDPSCKLNTFCVAPFNRFAFEAAQAACLHQAPVYNPLFIEAPLGLGKTHLLHAIGNALTTAKGSTAAYLDCGQAGEYGSSGLDLHSKTLHHALTHVEVLLVDNVHLLPVEGNFQHNLSDIFDEFYNLNRQMVFTATSLPNKIPHLISTLRSRLNWGLLAKITEPEPSDSILVIDTLFSAAELSPSPELSSVLAKQRPFNFRRSRECVQNLQRIVEKEGSLPDAKQIQDLFQERRGSEEGLSILAVQQAVCDDFAVSLGALLGTGKTRPLVSARQVGMYLSRKLTGTTYAVIGSSFGGRDHSTVIYACRKVSSEVKRNRDFAERIVQVERKLLKSFRC
jgi:chromosomal replication initiator protein